MASAIVRSNPTSVPPNRDAKPVNQSGPGDTLRVSVAELVEASEEYIRAVQARREAERAA